MSTPALNIPIRVTGLDTFRNQMNQTTVLAANATRAAAEFGIKASAGFLASQGAAGAATIAFGRLLGAVRPIALGITAVVDSFEFLKTAVHLAGQQIEAFNSIAQKANGAGVSTDFFQRFTKSAPAATLSIEQATEALQRFNQATTERLGGSDLQQEIKRLTDAGNFAGNSGVSAFANASNTEARFRAIVLLIREALSMGQRLAGLEIASKGFGEPVTAALRADSGYLDEISRKIDAMSKSEIVSQADIGRAIQLRDRMEEAQRILAERWAPVQRDIAQLGINFKDNWTSVVETFASLVALADKLYEALKRIPDLFASFGNSDVWARFTELTGRLGLNSTPEAMGLETGINAERIGANSRLGAELQNPASARRAMQEATTVQTDIRGDKSIVPTTATGKEADKVDQAIASLQRHNEMLRADAQAAGLADAALARFRAQAQETAAVQANGGKETQAQAEKFKGLQDASAAAAEALAKARVNSEISFGRQTALLSPEDLQIANQLKGIYGNDVPAALASTEAASLRVNNQLKSVGDAIRNDLSGPLTDFITGSKSAGDAFKAFADSMLRDLVRMGTEALIIKPLISGLGALATGGIPGFANGTDNAPGGLALVGERGPELVNLPRGTAVYTAPMTARLLQQIPKFADGGVMGGGSAPPLIQTGGAGSFVMGDINIHGASNGSPAQNRDLADQIAGQVKAAASEMLGKELRNQMRPGGTIRSMIRR